MKVGDDQEMLQSEEILTPKTEVGKKTKLSGTYTKKTYGKPSELLFSIGWPLSYSHLTKYMKMYIHVKYQSHQANGRQTG